jgi:peptidoglycan/LPS O-acetylase OafA/YrhL
LAVPTLRRSFIKLYAPIQPTTQSSIPSLDALRGLAALGIALFHTFVWLAPLFDSVGRDLPILKQLYKTVPMFVVLSGFLIYRSIRSFQTIDDLKYYAQRRFLRIYPLYVISTVIFFLVADIRPTPISWLQRVIPDLFMMKVFGYPTFISPPNWSLYVEELFYLSIPIWVACTKTKPRRFTIFGFILFSLIGSAVPDEIAIIKYFFIGMIICDATPHNSLPDISQSKSGLAFISGLILLYAEVEYGDLFGVTLALIAQSIGFTLVYNVPYYPQEILGHSFSPTLGIALGLIVYGCIQFKPVTNLLGIFPLRFLGTISFSVFIWNGLFLLHGTNRFFFSHVPTFSNANTAYADSFRAGFIPFFLIYSTAFIFIGAISYAAFERPFLLLKAKLKHK